MKCNKALLLMDTVLDDEATSEEEQLLQFHVNGCSRCRKVMLFNQSLTKRMKMLEEAAPSSDIMDIVKAKIASGQYDQSPIENKKYFKLPTWRIAAAVPFVAALAFFLQAFTGTDTQDYENDAFETAAALEATMQYTPAPVIAYSRPSSILTF